MKEPEHTIPQFDIEEQWKDIAGYEGLYQVSSYGRVKSLHRYGTKGGILKPGLSNNKYLIIILSKNNKIKINLIHRLVALHFIVNSNNKPQVNHKDGNKQNNYYKNLEWCTYSENTQHAYDTGLKKITIKQKESYSKKVYCPELDQEFNSTREVERKLNINQSNISACCKGRYNFAGKHPNNSNIKLTWKYITSNS